MYTKITVNNVYIAFISKWQEVGSNITSRKKHGDSLENNYRTSSVSHCHVAIYTVILKIA